MIFPLEVVCSSDLLLIYPTQVEHFQAGMQAQQARLKSLREQYTQSKHEAQRDLAKFSDERVTLYAHISSAQEEYDCLKVVQAEETQKYAQHISEEKQVHVCYIAICMHTCMFESFVAGTEDD